ncbi:uncharacterized protein LOC132745569 [Ruditapes philippinarum]|uniref:uncharacterized protein LOC132745569 n=1 Tax=Ruditapes philippinarum TaxID=129788 RepID=UPI00295A9A52|nr:uncharacterized protein LOC132745569 [Ruditapes philippinarum]
MSKTNVRHVSDSMLYRNDESWDTCIERRSESGAKILLEKEILPSKSELNKASCVFGRGSTIFSNICSVISKHIKNMSVDVIDVCPSYKADSKSIVFIVFLKGTSQFVEFKDYECKKIYENESSVDEEHAIVYERKVNTRNQSDDKIFEKLRKCINKNADDLFKRHSNLNVILPSLKKTVGNKSGQHTIIEEPRITLFVTVKGLIPSAEERFKKDIDGFRTDVLEGEFKPYFGGPNEFHEHLKIGLAIRANIENGSIGTLGGFIEHPQHGLCGITCAHVIYTLDELKMIKENTPFKMDKLVHQPTAYHTPAFGKVVLVVYNEGDDIMSGMEVAIFSIQDRKPKDGSFPKVLNDIQAGFDDDHPLCFNSGDIREMKNINPRTEVYKLGMSSGITRGSFELQGAAVRRRQMQGRSHSFGFHLKNQIVILPIGHDPFAEPGDSGALVLMEGEKDSVAIGIVEGGMHGFVFVTPICDILRAAGCTELKMYQFKTEQKAYSTDSGVGMDADSV